MALSIKTPNLCRVLRALQSLAPSSATGGLIGVPCSLLSSDTGLLSSWMHLNTTCHKAYDMLSPCEKPIFFQLTVNSYSTSRSRWISISLGMHSCPTKSFQSTMYYFIALFIITILHLHVWLFDNFCLSCKTLRYVRKVLCLFFLTNICL